MVFLSCIGQFNGRSGQFNGRSGQFNGRNGQFNGRSRQCNGRSGQFNGRSGQFNGRNGQFNGRSRQCNGRNGQFNSNRGQFNGSRGQFNGRSGQFLATLGTAFILTPTPASQSRLGLNMYAHCPAVHSHSLHSSAVCGEHRSSSCQYHLRLTASRKLEQFGGHGPNANALPSSANHLSRLSAAAR